MVSITCSAGIQVAVPGEEFLTFQEMGIQNLSWASKERTQILEMPILRSKHWKSHWAL